MAQRGPQKSSQEATQLGPQGFPLDFVPISITAQIAPWVIGALLDVFLAGFVLSLVSNYFYNSSEVRLLALLIRSKTNSNKNQSQNVAIPASHRPRNAYRWASMSCQLLVAIVTALSIFKTACAIFIMIQIGIVHNGNDDFLGSMVYTQWPSVAGPITTSLIGLFVQIFYIIRLHRLLRAQDDSFLSAIWFRWLLMAMIFILALTSLALAAVTTQLITTLSYVKMDTFFSAHLGTMFGCDALITISTIICMLRTGQRVVNSKRSLLGKFVRFTVFSAAVPAILALLNLAFILNKNQYVLRWHVTANFAISKAYVITLLLTLEYRRRVANESAENNHVRPHAESISVHDGRRSLSDRSPPPHAFSFARTVSYYDIELQKPPTLH